MNKNKTKILEPRKNKNLRPVKMLYENIANQYYYKEGELKYSLEEIADNINTLEQEKLFERFKSTQVEIATWINRAERLSKDMVAYTLMLRYHFYDYNFEGSTMLLKSPISVSYDLKKPIKYETTDGVVLTYSYREKEFEFENFEVEVIEDGSVSFFINRTVRAVKELTVLSNLIFELGDLWDIGTFMAIGQDFKGILKEFEKEMSQMKDLNIFVLFPLLSKKAIEEIRQGLSDTTAQAPILQGYYTAYSDFESRVGVFYGRPNNKKQ